ncbi:MAG: hypothetical protein GEV11_19965 [Streptosporangiales bacterium]|nr:hypothetical protein [Streptosporangiales bacterium]
MALGAAHWVYLAGMALIIGVMVARKNVVIPAIAATFLTAWVFTGSFITGLQSIFNAGLTAAQELFNIFLIIAFVTALLGALRSLGADRRMVEPFRPVMRNGHVSFWVVALVTYVISLFFWPTPAVPLIGAILLPAAIRSGLSPIAAGLSVAVAGQGMALSSDYVIQVAPGLSAKAAGVSASAVADDAMILSLITGGVALVLCYLMTRNTITAPSAANLRAWLSTSSSADVRAVEAETEAGAPAKAEATSAAVTVADGSSAAGAGTGVAGTGVAGAGAASEGAAVAGARAASAGGSEQTTTAVLDAGDDPPGDTGAELMEADGDPPPADCVRRSKAFAVIVPLAFLGLVVYMLLGKFTGLLPETVGSEAAALVGGVAAVLLLAASITRDGRNSLQTCTDHVIDGLVFAFKAMGAVVPIAGFFFIGNADFSGQILGLAEDAKGPGFLFDLVSAGQQLIPGNAFVVALGMLIIGMITGLDGSGFSGLPLTGSLAGSLGPAVGADPAMLAAVGQMGAIWAGGGVLIAWSSLLAVAGFARVPAMELARRAFIPVTAGLLVSTVVAVMIL